ncbi:MFS transporter [Burkholderia sp. MBR-1]|uniref:MFS transporter n=1 Tax=Burkholderia sp. MBR-1 TaxID=2732364 RepID=UPI0015EE4FCE|nr:MFS transporter [Burkholderia sp. MBR-1]QMI49549.1 MFS transporter [Burkholderia sp. MBR-1]
MPTITQTAAAPAAADLSEDAVYRRVMRRILPLLLLCYVVAYLDRVNVGFAKLQMLDDLSLSDGVYALGASIFFWGYFLFEMPSNLLLHRYGARFWIARIMITWGIVSSSMAFIVPLAQFFHVQTSTMFYALRFLLGLCEAGFFPGVILYMNYWFPARRQSVAMSGFLVAIPLSLTLGSVVSGWLMEQTHGLSGMSGWQWMLLLEGLPSIIRASGVRSPLHIGLLTAIPYLTAIFAMLWNASHSRKTGERRLHAAIPALIGGVGLIASAACAQNVALSIVFLTIATCAILALMPIYWTFPGQILSGTAAAAGIALINSVGNLSGFTGSMITGIAKEMTGNINNGTYALGACLLISCVLILSIPRSILVPPAER